jgi:hypothetical protein
VVVRALVEGRAARVRFVLGPEDYARACDAHRDRRRVAVTGVVRREPPSRVFELVEPQQFQVIEGP